jgi:hypothetical protein
LLWVFLFNTKGLRLTQIRLVDPSLIFASHMLALLPDLQPSSPLWIAADVITFFIADSEGHGQWEGDMYGGFQDCEAHWESDVVVRSSLVSNEGQQDSAIKLFHQSANKPIHDGPYNHDNNCALDGLSERSALTPFKESVC